MDLLDRHSAGESECAGSCLGDILSSQLFILSKVVCRSALPSAITVPGATMCASNSWECERRGKSPSSLTSYEM